MNEREVVKPLPANIPNPPQQQGRRYFNQDEYMNANPQRPQKERPTPQNAQQQGDYQVPRLPYQNPARMNKAANELEPQSIVNGKPIYPDQIVAVFYSMGKFYQFIIEQKEKHMEERDAPEVGEYSFIGKQAVVGIEDYGPGLALAYGSDFFVQCRCQVSGLRFVVKSLEHWEDLKANVLIRICTMVLPTRSLILSSTTILNIVWDGVAAKRMSKGVNEL